jgi:hypothetical protein
LFSETKRERESTTQWFSFVVSFPCLADVFIFKARRFHFTDTAEDVIRQCFCFKDVKVNSWSQLPCAQKPLTKHTLRTGEGGEGRGGGGGGMAEFARKRRNKDGCTSLTVMAREALRALEESRSRPLTFTPGAAARKTHSFIVLLKKRSMFDKNASEGIWLKYKPRPSFLRPQTIKSRHAFCPRPPSRLHCRRRPRRELRCPFVTIVSSSTSERVITGIK